MLNLFYGRLVTQGRIKTDASTVMYEYWVSRRTDRAGLGPTPAAVAAACGVSIHAARAALTRFRAGRQPTAPSPGLAPVACQRDGTAVLPPGSRDGRNSPTPRRALRCVPLTLALERPACLRRRSSRLDTFV